MGNDTEEGLSRRRFFNFVGWGSLGAFFAGLGGAGAKFFYPGVLYEPASTFNAGKPDEFVAPAGDETVVVDERFKKNQRVWVLRNRNGIYAMIGVCTHLGCTPNWFPGESVFKCPCHGSIYNVEGEVIGGPAPEPLYRPRISLAADGTMIITTGLLGIRRPAMQMKKIHADVFWHDDEKEVIRKAPYFLQLKS